MKEVTKHGNAGALRVPQQLAVLPGSRHAGHLSLQNQHASGSAAPMSIKCDRFVSREQPGNCVGYRETMIHVAIHTG